MELNPATAETYVRHAFAQMFKVADHLGEPLINEQPLGPKTNSVAALIIHCCEVTEFWLGHVALGHPSDRDRDSEFHRAASISELHAFASGALERAVGHLARLEAGEGKDEGGRGAAGTAPWLCRRTRVHPHRVFIGCDSDGPGSGVVAQEPTARPGRRTVMIGRVGQFGLVLIALTLALVACGGGRTESVGDPPSDPPPPLTLYVSNQSFEDATVGIVVTIDGSQVVNHNFEVEDQHNFVRFEPQGLTSGKHTLQATASTGPSFTKYFTIRDGEPLWAYLGYEFDSDEAQHKFSFRVSNEQIHFA